MTLPLLFLILTSSQHIYTYTNSHIPSQSNNSPTPPRLRPPTPIPCLKKSKHPYNPTINTNTSPSDPDIEMPDLSPSLTPPTPLSSNLKHQPSPQPQVKRHCATHGSPILERRTMSMWRSVPSVKERINSDEELGSAVEPSTVYVLSRTSVFRK